MSTLTGRIPRDANRVPILGVVSSADSVTVIGLQANPSTNRLLVDSGSGTAASQIQGISAQGATTGQGNPVRVGAKYKATPATLADGATADLVTDINENLKTTLATLLAGEDLVNNRQVTETRFQFATIITATTTTIKTGPGVLHSITLLGGTAGAITVYDNTAGSGTAIAPTFSPSAVSTPVTLIFDASVTTGITIVTAAATILSISYR